MVEKRRGLGRGLGALIPSAPVEEVPSVEVPVRRPGGRPADLFFEASRNHSEAIRVAAQQDNANEASIHKDALPESPRPKTRSSPRTSVPSLKPRKAAAPISGAASRPDYSVPRETAGFPPSTAEENAVLQDPGAGRSSQIGGGAPTAPVVDGSNDPVAHFVDADDTTADSVPSETPTNPEWKEAAEGGPVLVDVPGARFAELPVDSIHANRKQPRQEFDADELSELVLSIREVGVLQPIVVRPSQEGGDADFELVMGERRWRATKEAGLGTVPAIIRLTADDDLLRDALLENLHRSSLNPLEEAAAYQQLLDDFGCSHEELSGRIGRSRPQISNTLRLMKLPPLVQRRVAAGIISAGHARALLGLSDQADMEKMAQRIVAEGLSVRSTEEIVAMSDGLRRPAKDAKPRAGARHERLDYLASSLSDRLDTGVKITLGARKGKVSIEFASVDDLNRIMGVLAPTEG